MVKFVKVEDVNELKMGQTLVTVDTEGYESVDYIDCIDNGMIYTLSAMDKENDIYPVEEDLDTFLEDYDSVYIITGV